VGVVGAILYRPHNFLKKIAPPKHYSGRYGLWKKAVFHHHLDQAIVDLTAYRTPDFTVMDATIGLADRWPSYLILIALLL
jgi:hypothetical protein